MQRAPRAGGMDRARHLHARTSEKEVGESPHPFGISVISFPSQDPSLIGTETIFLA